MIISAEYIAGFFDGEGSVGIYSRKDRLGGFGLRVQLTQNTSTDSQIILQYLQNKYGGNLTTQKTLSDKLKYNWQLNSNKAVLFLKDIYPYSILKRKQIEVAIYFQENRPTIKRNSGGEIQSHNLEDAAWCVEQADKIKRLKHE